MAFHLGKPILVMLVFAMAGGVMVGLRDRGGRDRPDLLVWVFADSHLKVYRGEAGGGAGLSEEYGRRTGKRVGVELVSSRAQDVRLVSLFMSGSHDVPDLVELEIGSVAKYFRPPTGDVGLLPLNDLLKESGWMDKVLKARFAPWSKNGVIYGVPHDVHPCTIVYRDDLFREAGIDLAGMRTWPAFRDACVRFQDYWRARGEPNRHAIELMNASADHLIPMLLQRHLNLIDGDGRIEMTGEKFIETLAFYAGCVAGPRKIAAQSPAAAAGQTADLLGGNICALITPDWRVDQIKQYAPGLAGRMRMMPMPIFEPGDARTASWGGTMIGIPRHCKDPRAAWRLLEFLYFSKEGLAARRRSSAILPPVLSEWDDPAYRRPGPYFGGQQVDLLYIEMARELPARYVTPATPIAGAYLSKAIADAADYVERNPGDYDGLVAQCRAWMERSATDLRRRVAHGAFEEQQ